MNILHYALLMGIGAFLGTRQFSKKFIKKNLAKFQNLILLLLIFVMGVSIGQNKIMLDNIASLGIKSLIFAAITIAFSVIAVNIYVRIKSKRTKN